MVDTTINTDNLTVTNANGTVIIRVNKNATTELESHWTSDIAATTGQKSIGSQVLVSCVAGDEISIQARGPAIDLPFQVGNTTPGILSIMKVSG